MKRKALLICLLAAMTFPIQAKVNYQPSISVEAGGTFTYKFNDMLRSSISVAYEFDPIAIQIDRRHTISMPVYASYVSRTPAFDGYCLNSHMDYGFGLSYRYTVNDVLSIRAKADVNMQHVLEVEGVMYSCGFTVEPWLSMNSKIAFNFPMRLGIAKGAVSFAPSVGLVLTPFGVKP